MYPLTISTCTSVRPYVPFVHPVTLPIPTVVSQNVINKSCLACVMSEKYAFLVTLRPLGSKRRGKAKPHTLRKKAKLLAFHHLPCIDAKQLCALAHLGCTREAGTS